MYYQTIQVTEIFNGMIVTLHRPIESNSINLQLIDEIHHLLDQVEKNPSCRMIILQGEKNVFCTGMDFNEAMDHVLSQEKTQILSSRYMSLIKRFTITPKIIISLLDGQVLAGGVGIVAASDIVISTYNTHFSLSEALWGLLPACVTPFLIRRVGFQKAYYMTLTTQTIHSREAHSMGLIDELTDNLQDAIRRNILRLNRVSEETVLDLKVYFQKMWIVTEEMENLAIQETARLMEKRTVRENIKNYIEQKKFPWEMV